MRLLDECLELSRALKIIDERIFEINTSLYSPKTQIISAAPRGSGVESLTDKLIMKKEQLTSKRERLNRDLQEKWENVIEVCCRTKITKQQVQLLYLRFHEGKTWKECTSIMQKRYVYWNENKSFREYRDALSKMHNRTEQTG